MSAEEFGYIERFQLTSGEEQRLRLPRLAPTDQSRSADRQQGAELAEYLRTAIQMAGQRLDRIPEGHPAAIHIRSRQRGYQLLLRHLEAERRRMAQVAMRVLYRPPVR